MNLIKNYGKSEGEIQNLIMRYTALSKKSAIIVTNINIESNNESDLKCMSLDIL